jgi:hypothetical protein
MKTTLIATALICSSIACAAAQSVEWRLAGFIDGIPDRTSIVVIEPTGLDTTIRSFDGASVASASVIDVNGNPSLYRKYAADGTVSFEAAIANGRRIIARSGGREWNGKSPGSIVLTDPSSFWVFSLWLSRDSAFV